MNIPYFLISFAFSLLFSALLIPYLRRKKAGQAILSYVTEHQTKAGTPTMGGLAFVSATAISSLFLPRDRLLSVALAVGVGYLLVGFLDDLIKIKTSNNLGLKAYQKIVFQIAIALIVSVFCYTVGITNLEIPFFHVSFDLGIWSIPYHSFVFLAAVNCVNLTDGLDGLAAGVSLAYFLCFSFLIVGSLSSLSICLAGSLMAYLIFNVSKASVFMGDTGSLSLGGFVAIVAILSGKSLYLPIIGFPFVLSGVSVILQVVYFKLTKGKRIFLMAPIHHHFQKKGFAESKIAYCYFLSSLIAGLCCIVWG